MDAINLVKFVTTNILILNSTLGIENSFDTNCVFTIEYDFSINGSDRIIQYLETNTIIGINTYLDFIKIDTRELSDNLFEVALLGKLSDDNSNVFTFNIKSFVKTEGDHSKIYSYEIYNIKDLNNKNTLVKNNTLDILDLVNFCLKEFIDFVAVIDLDLKIYTLYKDEQGNGFSLSKVYNSKEEFQVKTIPNLAKEFVDSYLTNIEFNNIKKAISTHSSYLYNYEIYSESGTTDQITNYFYKYNDSIVIMIQKNTTEQYNEILRIKYNLR